jgi:hypothetical protein
MNYSSRGQKKSGNTQFEIAGRCRGLKVKRWRRKGNNVQEWALS